MKRFLAGLLALMLLLSACAADPEPTDPPETTEPSTEQPTEPEGPQGAWEQFYEQASTVEVLTKGAVKQYLIDLEDPYAVSAMGDGLLIFAGAEETVLTYFGAAGELYSRDLTECFIYPDGQTTHVSDTGVCYYDSVDNAVVYLNEKLEETARIGLPQQISGPIFLSADGEIVYYVTADALRWLELRTGISRSLTEISFDHQELTGLHLGGKVLECWVTRDGIGEVLYISAETGQTLFSTAQLPMFYSQGDAFFAQWKQGSVTERVFGTMGGEKRTFLLEDDQLSVRPLFGLNAALSHQTDSTGTTMEYYDLTSGNRSGSVRMAGVGNPWSMAEDAGRGLVWFLATGMSADSAVVLYSWEPALSPTGDTHSYCTPYYTELEPDEQRLKEIRRQAEQIGDRYGVRIRVWQDALRTMPSDYNFTGEHLVQAYQRALPVIEKALAQFPEGVFKKMGSQSNNKVLTVCLIRGAYGSNELGSLEEATGVHFWDNGNSYLALTMGDHLEQTFYHELFHAMDSYILTETLAFDFWDDLNPKGFKYDYSYVTNQYREDDQYLEGADRAFIDTYSMSYPKEDRARIMEYAVMEGCAAYFESDIMQAKLKTVCKGIREAFDLKKDSRVFLWEQYLKESL